MIKFPDTLDPSPLPGRAQAGMWTLICQELDGDSCRCKEPVTLTVDGSEPVTWRGDRFLQLTLQCTAFMKMDSSASWAVTIHQTDKISKKHSTVDPSKPLQFARRLPSEWHCKPKESNYISKVNSTPVFHLHAALIERSQDASFIQGRVSKAEKQNENQVNQLNS